MKKQRREVIETISVDEPTPVSQVIYNMFRNAQYPIAYPLKAASEDESTLLSDVPRVFDALFAVKNMMEMTA